MAAARVNICRGFVMVASCLSRGLSKISKWVWPRLPANSCLPVGSQSVWNFAWVLFFFFLRFTLFFCNFILFLNFTIFYWFCQISKWIRHRYTCVPHPDPSFLLPPHTIPLGHPIAPAPGIQYRASNLDWQLVSYMILYMFQCHSPKSSHPLPLSQSPKDCSIHQCLFCCLVYRVIVTIFLNSIYMH